MSRFVRTYDTEGQIIEEESIWENPVPLFLESGPSQQIQTLGRIMDAVLRGQAQAVSYTYDAKGRTTTTCRRNFAFESSTIIAYNDQGGKAEERQNFAQNTARLSEVRTRMSKSGLVPPNTAPNRHHNNHAICPIRPSFTMSINMTATITGHNKPPVSPLTPTSRPPCATASSRTTTSSPARNPSRFLACRFLVRRELPSRRSTGGSGTC